MINGLYTVQQEGDLCFMSTAQAAHFTHEQEQEIKEHSAGIRSQDCRVTCAASAAVKLQ